jgi:predicted Zn-dependent peptidase
MSSVVFQTIRESKALAYSSYAYFSSPSRKEKPFTFYAFVGTQSDKVFDAINAMNELIAELPESDQSFNTAKKSIKSSIEAQRIRNEQVVFNYLSSRRLGIDYDIRKNIYNQIDALTFADLTQFHQDFIKNKTGAYAILGSSKRIDKKKLGQYGTLKQMKTKNLFNY